MHENNFILNTDGGARGNPGPAAIGFVISTLSGKVLQKHGETIGDATNNQAEYKALIEGLKVILVLGGEKVVCLMDSELVVKQMQGKYKIKEQGLKILASEALRLIARLKNIEFKHIPREQNQLADQLVNGALDEEEESKK
jgi:ribonuclease HI